MAAQADLEKLRANLGGVKNMQRVPDALFVIDLKTEAIAVREAQRLRIPIIGLVDTNCDPDGIDYVIPGNDDAIRACDIITQAIGDVIARGQRARFREEEERARQEAEEQARREAEEKARREAEEQARRRPRRPPRRGAHAGRGATRDAAEATVAEAVQDLGVPRAEAPPRPPRPPRQAADEPAMPAGGAVAPDAARARQPERGRAHARRGARGRRPRRRGRRRAARRRAGRHGRAPAAAEAAAEAEAPRRRPRRRRPRPRAAAEAAAPRPRAAAAEPPRRPRRPRSPPPRRPAEPRSRAAEKAEEPAPRRGRGRRRRRRHRDHRDQGRGQEVSTPTITAKHVKELRDRTGAGMMDCKKALEETDGDVEKAVELLRVRLGDKALKMGGREATEGTVQSYIHGNGKVGVLVEVDCNTDFVARNDDFIAFAREVALHIAAVADGPLRLRGRHPGGRQGGRAARVRAAGRRQARERPRQDRRGQAAQVDGGGRAAQAAARQPATSTSGKTIEQLRAELSGTTGENVVIRRFARFAVGA